MEVADRVMYVQGKECQKLPANDQKLRERHGLDSPMQPLKEPPLLTLGSWVASLQNWGREPCRFTVSSLVFKGSVRGLVFSLSMFFLAQRSPSALCLT